MIIIKHALERVFGTMTNRVECLLNLSARLSVFSKSILSISLFFCFVSAKQIDFVIYCALKIKIDAFVGGAIIIN